MSSDEMTFQMMVKRLKSSSMVAQCAQWFNSKQCVTVILDLKVFLAQLHSSACVGVRCKCKLF